MYFKTKYLSVSIKMTFKKSYAASSFLRNTKMIQIKIDEPVCWEILSKSGDGE